MSKIAGIYYNDTAAGLGWSVSVYFSGCEKHCPGCHNPEAQDFNFGQPLTAEKMDEIVSKLHENGVARSLSLLGGEPLNEKNRSAAWKLIEKTKAAYPDTKIFVWTGYELLDLIVEADEERKIQGDNNSSLTKILETIDYLIDGAYVEAQRDITLPLRGSKNQLIFHCLNSKNNRYYFSNITEFVDKGTWIF